jgi:hypothetical protein
MRAAVSKAGESDTRRTPLGAWVALRRGGTPVSHTGVRHRVTRPTPVLPFARVVSPPTDAAPPAVAPAMPHGVTREITRMMPVVTQAHAPLAPAVARSAESALRLAIAGDPDLAQVRVGLATILREDGRMQEAEQELLRALESVPTFSDAARSLAELRVDLGRPSDAMQALVKPLRANPRDVDLLIALAEALLGLGREEQALSAIARGAAVAADHAGVRTLQGYMALRSGRTADALEHWRVASASTADDRWVTRARVELAEHDDALVPQTPVTLGSVRSVSG